MLGEFLPLPLPEVRPEVLLSALPWMDEGLMVVTVSWRPRIVFRTDSFFSSFCNSSLKASRFWGSPLALASLSWALVGGLLMLAVLRTKSVLPGLLGLSSATTITSEGGGSRLL